MRCKWGVKVVLTNDIIRVNTADTVDTVAPWTRRLETPPLGPGLCRAEGGHLVKIPRLGTPLHCPCSVTCSEL